MEYSRGVQVLTKALVIAILIWHLFACVWSFYLHALDKRRAAIGGRRIPERDLLLTCLLGGWFGGRTARSLLNHKTKKQPYVTLFWTAAALHVVTVLGVMYLVTRSG